MAGFRSPITINEAMQRIKNNEYLLPAFQREYVWESWQVEELFDSLMRGYPISSMLFWEVKDESKSAWKFYRFLDYYREYYHEHNEYFNTQNHKDFKAILDGQQRLTSLYLALFSHYDIHKYRKKWENDDRVFDICHLYFNLTQSQVPENSNVKYEFLWLGKDETKEQSIHIDKHQQKWFKCSAIYDIQESNKVREFAQNNKLSNSEWDKLDAFHILIFNTKDESKINFYLETEQNPEKAVNIFIRINSGGEPLDYSDILFSIAIANWKNIDARSEINGLVDKINQEFHFNIKKDLILRGFLFLFHNSIKFQIKSFDKDFIESIEGKWESIRDCFIETFRLLRRFSLDKGTLSSNNAILPILYFIYHNNFTEQIADSTKHKQNREFIKTWLLRAIILKPFGGSGDNVLTNMRKAFIKDFKQNDKKYFDETLESFPLKKIEQEAAYSQTIDDEYLENNIIDARKNSPEAFAALSLLFNMRKDIQVHIDHLHPISAYKQRSKEERKEYEYWANTLPNLQLLEGGENMSKQDKPLKEWIKQSCVDNNREAFLRQCLIPVDIDLSLENFDEFYEVRKKLLKDKLKEILNRNF